MSKAQKLISGIFAFVFALVIAPTASFAATNYNLSVNGEQFTSENSPSSVVVHGNIRPRRAEPHAQQCSITNAVDYGGIDSELTGDLTITLQEVTKSPSTTI